MFSVLQIDPETSAIHVNVSAIGRHRNGELLSRVIDLCLDHSPQTLIRFLRQQNEGALQAELAGFASNIIHEVRHYLDLLLTPYGFYRLRVAFEFYSAFPAVLADEGNPQIPVPLISGGDPLNQQILGLREYSTTLAKRFSDIALSRTKILSMDNQSHRLPNGSLVKIGGDAILEALAYTIQYEWLSGLFPTPECRERHARFFDDYNASRFDAKYRWFVPLWRFLNPTPNRSTVRLMICILFASLFGSFARGAKYFSQRDLGSMSTRYFDECLPSHRFSELLTYFKNNPAPDVEDPATLFAVVDRACEILFGAGLAASVEVEIGSDQKFVDTYIASNARLPDTYAVFAFQDLIDTRRALLELFKSEPESFVHPPLYITRIAPLVSPPIVRIDTMGVTPHASPAESDRRELCMNTFRYAVVDRDSGEQREVAETYCYAHWTPKEKESSVTTQDHTESWEMVFSWFSPLYKGLLYGHKYRSMLEIDIKKALEMPVIRDKLVWDPDYRESTDVSAPDEYFEFFELEVAACDVCGKEVNRGGAVIVSGLTLRQNERFVEHYLNTHEPEVVLTLLARDWSSWLICNEEAHSFGFVSPPVNS